MSQWPVTLADDRIGLRPMHRDDAKAYKEVRAHNKSWLYPWEASSPVPGYRVPEFRALVRMLNRQARLGLSIPWAVTFDGEFRGQLTVSGIQWGSLRNAQIGYWIDHRVAGQGVIPTAVALAVDHCFFTLGLHRIEVNIRPENIASLRVVEKLGFRDEGVRAAYMHINGEWADHRTFALTREDLPEGLLNYWDRVRWEDEDDDN